MSDKELLSAFLSQTLKMDESGVASLYNEAGELRSEALDELLKLDVERVSKLKPDVEKIKNDQYKKGVAEGLGKLEKDFKEKTGFISEKLGVELFLDYAAEQAKANSKITDDVIKKHPVYITALDKLKQEREDAIKAEQEKFNQFQQELSKKETFNSVSKKAMELFLSWNPVLSPDQLKAKNQINDFVEKLKNADYDIQGEKIIITKEGKLLEDGHGNMVEFDKFVRGIADTYYDFHKSDPKGSPNNGNQGQQKPTGGSTIVVPKSEAEYNKVILDKSIPLEERTKISEAYLQQKAGNN